MKIPTKQNKQKTLSVRLTEELYAKLTKIATQNKVSLADVIAHLIKGAT